MKNRYVIYKCSAIRNDKTKIIRIIKIQSHFQAENLAIALIATSDSEETIKEIKFENDGYEDTFDHNNLIYDGLSFDELEETNIKVTLVYEDGIKIQYDCVQIGEEITQNRITRTTPIIIEANGMSRFTHAEYIANHKEEIDNALKFGVNCDKYYDLEESLASQSIKDLQRFFNLYKEEYCV